MGEIVDNKNIFKENMNAGKTYHEKIAIQQCRCVATGQQEETKI